GRAVTWRPPGSITSIADRPIRRAGGAGSLTTRPRRAPVGVVPARARRARPRRTRAPVATVGGTRRPRRARTAGSAARRGLAVTGGGRSPATFTITIGGPARDAPRAGGAPRAPPRRGPARPAGGGRPGRPAGHARPGGRAR